MGLSDVLDNSLCVNETCFGVMQVVTVIVCSNSFVFTTHYGSLHFCVNYVTTTAGAGVDLVFFFIRAPHRSRWGKGGGVDRSILATIYYWTIEGNFQRVIFFHGLQQTNEIVIQPKMCLCAVNANGQVLQA